MSDRVISGQVARRDLNDMELSVHAAADDGNPNANGSGGSSGGSDSVGNSGDSSSTSANLGDLIKATSTQSSSKATSTSSSQSGSDEGQLVTVKLDSSSAQTVWQLSEENLTVSYEVKDKEEVTWDNFFWLNGNGDPIYDGTPNTSSFDDAVFREVTTSGVTINLSYLNQGTKSRFLEQTMRIRVGWTSGKISGDSSSDYFAVVRNESGVASASSAVSAAQATITAGQETTTAAVASATSESSASSGSKSGGGLGGGAIAGIVIGVIGGLLLIAAAAFFLLRKRRSNKKVGENYAAADSANAYMVDKETQGRATDTPNSPYSDENQARSLPINETHHEEPAITTAPPMGGVPRTSTGGSHNSRAETPQGVSSNVAHLVEDGMTLDEIRRLEEEERQLDDEIERAARR